MRTHTIILINKERKKEIKKCASKSQFLKIHLELSHLHNSSISIVSTDL